MLGTLVSKGLNQIMLKPGECHTINRQTFLKAENDTTHGVF